MLFNPVLFLVFSNLKIVGEQVLYASVSGLHFFLIWMLDFFLIWMKRDFNITMTSTLPEFSGKTC